MPTSGPGNRPVGARAWRGFTLIELLLVVAVIAISVAVVSLALRDASASKLEEEAARLAALLEMARAESRTSGATVRWAPALPGAEDGAQFRFVGLGADQIFPTRWLDPGTSVQIVGATSLLLGPEAILPAQRVVLRLGERELALGSDGLGPFQVAGAAVLPGGTTP
jgi:general secretion pathway protein H